MAKRKSGKGGKRKAPAPAKKRKTARKAPAPKPSPQTKRVTAHRPRKTILRRAGTAPRPMAPLKRTIGHNPYDTDLDRNAANYVPLSPLTFLERAASVFPARTAIIHGNQRRTYAEFYARARKLASALAKHGIRKGETVAVMLANTPPMLEAHYGVPMSGAVLNTLNTRLDAAALAFILDHGEAKVLITDREFSADDPRDPEAREREAACHRFRRSRIPASRRASGQIEYEEFIENGDPDFAWQTPADEWDAISLNYTSGTTGNPKGVVFHHRGAT